MKPSLLDLIVKLMKLTSNLLKFTNLSSYHIEKQFRLIDSVVCIIAIDAELFYLKTNGKAINLDIFIIGL